jgi:hypothetical protein
MDVALRHSKRGDETDVYRLVTMVLAPYGELKGEIKGVRSLFR